MSWSADVFHVGPQKSGTTWVYRCFREHPEIATSDVDAIHYYSMLYHRGNDWYRHQFPDSVEDQITFDPTPNYLRSPLVPERIARDNPQAKIIICIREPIERAFSHYWHEKKKNRYDFRFEEVLSNFDLFTNWVEPGFYSVHIERFLQHFPRESVKVVSFEDLNNDPEAFIRELYVFAGVDPAFVPSLMDRKVNVARPKYNLVSRGLRKLRLNRLPLYSEPMERLDEVPPAVVRELRQAVEPEIVRLESLLNIDLSAWRRSYDEAIYTKGAG